VFSPLDRVTLAIESQIDLLTINTHNPG